MFDLGTASLTSDATAYVYAVLGLRVHLRVWDGAGSLPAFLTGRYTFAVADGFGAPVLLVIDEADEPTPAAKLRTQLDTIQQKWPSGVAYVRERLTLSARRRLIEQRVPFIVPGYQLYLPSLGLDLREYTNAAAKSRPASDALRPATQAVFIFALLADEQKVLFPSAVATAVGCSQMTATRAFDELEQADLIDTVMVGRRRMLQWRVDRRKTWQQAQSRLIDPVRTRRYVQTDTDTLPGLIAGLDALSHRTMLAAPPRPVIAIESRAWSDVVASHPSLEVRDAEDASIEIELWRYAPRRAASDGYVEPLSLALTLRDLADERVEQAVDQMLGAITW